MKRADAKVKVALLLAAFLSWPVLRGVLDGSIPTTSGALRIGIAIALSYGGVLLVASVIDGYLPKPQPEAEETPPELEGVEDAVLVEDLAPAEDETEDAP